MQNPFDNQSPIKGVKNILLVSSGKGGVGKSTIAANIALALSKKHKVGLLDTDIYGPSIPRIFGTLHQKPELTKEGKILPLTQYGVKLMSIGYLVEEGAAIVWRGPMLFKALDQFFRDVEWGELDYLILDLPPGTGDVQLSIAQKVPVRGAIVVSTPQNLALSDVKKAVDMFDRVKIPVLGLIENMAYFSPVGSEQSFQLFPKGELDAWLDQKKIPKIKSLGFYPELAMSAEAGLSLIDNKPNASRVAAAFLEIAEKIEALV